MQQDLLGNILSINLMSVNILCLNYTFRCSLFFLLVVVFVVDRRRSPNQFVKCVCMCVRVLGCEKYSELYQRFQLCYHPVCIDLIYWNSIQRHGKGKPDHILFIIICSHMIHWELWIVLAKQTCNRYKQIGAQILHSFFIHFYTKNVQ